MKFKIGDFVMIKYNPYKAKVVLVIEKIWSFDEEEQPMLVEIRPIKEFETPNGFVSTLIPRTENVKDLLLVEPNKM